MLHLSAKYCGGVRVCRTWYLLYWSANNPSEVSTVLDLPHDTYPVFGLCIGWPDQDPEVKPRLPIDVVLRENSYGIKDGLNLGNYDEQKWLLCDSIQQSKIDELE